MTETATLEKIGAAEKCDALHPSDPICMALVERARARLAALDPEERARWIARVARVSVLRHEWPDAQETGLEHAARHACAVAIEIYGESASQVCTDAFNRWADAVVGRRATPAPRSTSAPVSTPGRRFDGYLAKHPIPAEGANADIVAAAWFSANAIPELGEDGFVSGILSERPDYEEHRLRTMWRAALRKAGR